MLQKEQQKIKGSSLCLSFCLVTDRDWLVHAAQLESVSHLFPTVLPCQLTDPQKESHVCSFVSVSGGFVLSGVWKCGFGAFNWKLKKNNPTTLHKLNHQTERKAGICFYKVFIHWLLCGCTLKQFSFDNLASLYTEGRPKARLKLTQIFCHNQLK